MDRSKQIFFFHRGNRYRLTHTVVDNSGSNARLVEADRNRHHRHTERKRFERCVDAGMGDAQLGSFEQFYLASLGNHDGVGRDRANVIHLNIAAY